MSQVLKLISRISRKVGGEQAQTYAMGGYAELSHKGNLDSLLPSELAHPGSVFWHRLLNHESLYYARESEKDKQRELVYIVTQMGLDIQGDAEILARGLTLAIAKLLRQRGYVVRHSFVGSVCTDSRPLDQPTGLHQLLYYRDVAPPDSQAMLEAILQRLRSWSDEFRRITCYWILGEYWDADEIETNRPLYEALRQKARQEAWFLHTALGGNGYNRPPSAKLFDRFEVIETNLLWTEEFQTASRSSETLVQ